VIWEAVLAAILYSLVFYAKKLGKGEKFDPYRFASTLIIGAVVGALMQAQGVPVEQMTFEQRLAMYAGAIALTESVLKAVVRYFRKKK